MTDNTMNTQSDDNRGEKLPFFTIKEGDAEATCRIQPGSFIVFGTDETCDMVLPFGKRIYPRHAMAEWVSSERSLRKLFDQASVEVNKRQISLPCTLNNGDIIKMGDITLIYRDPIEERCNCISPPSQKSSAGIAPPASRKQESPIPEHIFTDGVTTIGRDPRNTIVLCHEMVSRYHARIESHKEGYLLSDLNSTNGTFLNGVMIKSSLLTPDDLVHIGDFEFIFDGKSLKQASSENEARIDVLGLGRTLPNGTVLLRDINISIFPREFVAIVGSSGAGKSTLLNAMGGFSPATSGIVLLNGRDFYKYFDSFRSTLGYVPQDDIIHRELTVSRALYYSACLRLPGDVGKKEREIRIHNVMDDLQLLHRKNTDIWQLSGGERKRVSIGVELLTRPRLFYLDEPTSGLDPGLEADMMHTYRRLADQGRTLILITHATKNLHLCDQVVFLAQGGYLAFFGPPLEALRYFNANDFIDIYLLLEREQTPAYWGDLFRNSPEYRTYVTDRLNEVARKQAEAHRKGMAPAARPAGERKSRVSFLRQFFLLSWRYLEILYKDRRNFAILLLQAPFIGILLSVVYEFDTFDTLNGNYISAKSLVFFLVCIALWFGTNNSAREISKEIPIYRRERFINLGVAPYIFSKIFVLLLLCFLQTSVLMGIVFLKVKLPGAGFPAFRDIFLTLLLTSSAATTMGLMISSVVNNPDKATSLLPIILIPQLFFSGAIMPLKGGADLISYLALSKWSFELLGHITKVAEVPLLKVPVLKHTTDINYDIVTQTHWSILMGFFLLFVLIACLFQRLKDYQRIR